MKKVLFFLAIFTSQILVAQNVGIGLLTPNAKLSISVNGTELVGTASGNTLRTNAGSLGSTAGSELSLANIGFLSSNNSSLGIRAYRSSTGTDWTSTALLLGYDVDNTVRAGGGFLALSANGNIGIGTTTPGFPLSFAPTTGDKISLWSNSTNSYGFGIQSSLLQIHTDISAADIAFGYGSSGSFTEKMRIKGNGNMGIGVTNPDYPLDVTGNLSTTGRFVNTATSVDNYGLVGTCYNTPYYGLGIVGYGGLTGVQGIADLSGTGSRYGLFGQGANGIAINYGVYGEAIGGAAAYGIFGDASGTATNWAGYFNGSVYATVYSTSDRKLKNDIKPLSDALSIINQLKPSVYTFKTNEYKQMNLPGGLQYGLIADEVLQVMPGAVKKAVRPAQYENHNEHSGKKLSDEVEFNAVNYTEMIPVLIGAVKEQQLLINRQQKQIDELKKIVEKLLK